MENNTVILSRNIYDNMRDQLRFLEQKVKSIKPELKITYQGHDTYHVAFNGEDDLLDKILIWMNENKKWKLSKELNSKWWFKLFGKEFK